MKRKNKDKAIALCDKLDRHRTIVHETNNTGTVIKIYVNNREVSIPADHAKFLMRVIRDKYNAEIEAFTLELEAL